mmetsp:Transcript_37383/g.116870  ORF Transcript_37383/g.116870 Transcript_37383/m.116870 type:complete len:339 (-) Transcript_37383:383-1399(-)
MVFNNATITYNNVTYTGVNLVENVEACTQEWTFLDGVYYATITVTTVGYGDLAPSTEAGRIFGFFYILYGLAVVFTIINEVAVTVYAALESSATGHVTLDDILNADPKDAYRKIYKRMAMSAVIIVFLVWIGGISYMVLEEWTLLEGVWWAFATTSTVGYGDLSLTHDDSKVFSIVYVLGSVVIMATSLSTLGSGLADLKQEQRRQELLHANLNIEMITKMDLDGDGVDRFEFVTGMLKLLDQLTEEQIAPWSKRFNELDEDGSGLLDHDDLERLGREMEALQEEADAAKSHAHTPKNFMEKFSPTSGGKKKFFGKAPQGHDEYQGQEMKRSPSWTRS